MQRFFKVLVVGITAAAFLSCLSPNKYSVNRAFSATMNENSPRGTETIDHPEQFYRVIALSDVHGMYTQTLSLLKAGLVIDNKNNWISGNSLLIIIGDSIDKGPQSIEILDLWVRLTQQSESVGGKLIHVLGNHEAEFLSDPENDKKAAELINELKEKNIPVSDLTSVLTSRGAFLHSEPLAVRVGAWLFCHSGFYPNMSWADFTSQAQKILEDQDYKNDFLIGSGSILEMKDWEKSPKTRAELLKRMDSINIFGIVFGHQPKAFDIEGRSAAKENGRLIKIDNGIPPESGSHDGSLLVFTQPEQMNSKSYPEIEIILPDGKIQKLTPE